MTCLTFLIKWLVKKFVIHLRRLKEQEKLLIKCIESAEINKTSMCDTIYEEKDQVYIEFF